MASLFDFWSLVHTCLDFNRSEVGRPECAGSLGSRHFSDSVILVYNIGNPEGALDSEGSQPGREKRK